jgi:2-aminoethylphosphonate transport system ATP-binding protein
VTSVSDITGAAVTAAPSFAKAGIGNSISFQGVTVAYRGTVVLDRFSLDIDPGEIVALIGPSGSGKTTALRAVAGFVQPTAGRVFIGGEDVTDLPPYERGLGMVVQSYALFPHMRVEDNVAFGLRALGAPRDLIRERVTECLRIVGMSQYVKRYPRELSGGQQQRIAIARALAIRPRVLLLDEPLSALDAQIRRNMVDEIAKLHRDLPTLTVLYVTHDQSEALTLADRIAIMRGGKLAAFGPSRQLYQRPPNRFSAEFLGRANLLPVLLGSVDPASGLAHVKFGDRPLAARPGVQITVGDRCFLCVRPHDLEVAGDSDGNVLRGTVTSILWQGHSYSITIEAEGALVRLESSPSAEPPNLGAELSVRFAAESAVLVADREAS